MSRTHRLPPAAGAMRTGSWGGWLGRPAAVVLLALLSACGGGGDDGGTSLATTTTAGFTEGMISGFGSVVVNGVRFDDSAAQVLDDGGARRDARALKLGMQVEIEHDAVDRNAGSARAHVIRFGELVRGPVSAIDLAAGTLTVLGQAVVVRPTTVFDNALAGGLAALSVGAVVEVHGLFDSARNVVLASRIEPMPTATTFKVRGLVTGFDAQAKTFAIGGAAISFASLASSELPAALANGMLVRVTLSPAQVNARWVAVEIKGGPRKPADRLRAEVRGIVSAFTSTRQFSVNGLPVDASSAAFKDGTAGLVLGALVEVEGVIHDGVLVASEVELEDHHRNDDNRRLALHGEITAIDRVARTLVVKGTLVRYGGEVDISRGNASDLALGVTVEVIGVLASDGVSVQATKIRIMR